MTKKILTGLDLNGPLTVETAAGSAGQVLTSGGSGSTPSWTTVSSGGLTASSYVTQGRLTGDTTVTANADLVIPFVDDFDLQNWWDAGTKKFTPTTSGYYQITLQVWWAAAVTGTGQNNIQVRKNGSTVAISQQPLHTGDGTSQNATKLIYLNGSTDYVDFTAYTNNTTSQTIQWGGNSNGQGTFFSAALVTSGANTTSNALTISSPLTGTSFNGSSAVTIGLNQSALAISGSQVTSGVVSPTYGGTGVANSNKIYIQSSQPGSPSAGDVWIWY